MSDSPLARELVDAASQASAEKDAELAKLQWTEDLRAVLGTQAGRRMLWKLLDGECMLWSPSWTGEALSMAYQEGRRAVGVALLKELQRAAPVDYLAMVSEQLAAKARE